MIIFFILIEDLFPTKMKERFAYSIIIVTLSCI